MREQFLMCFPETGGTINYVKTLFYCVMKVNTNKKCTEPTCTKLRLCMCSLNDAGTLDTGAVEGSVYKRNNIIIYN